jgi:hypothetical protein
MAPLEKDSIETCLTHVRQSDYVIVILSHRYGPSLKSAGFDDLSATHLEYREARNSAKPIRFYVRDRLEADYHTWRKNKKISGIKLPWVDDRDFGLFALIDEHKHLVAGGPNNWFDAFRHSIELKQLISRDFHAPSGRETIVSAVTSNSLPYLDITLDVQHNSRGLALNVVIKNIGNSPAFNLAFFKTDDPTNKGDPVPILAPGQTTGSAIITFRGTGSVRVFETELAVNYRLLGGHDVRELHRLFFEPQGVGWRSGTALTNKKFYLSSEEKLPFTIEDGPAPEMQSTEFSNIHNRPAFYDTAQRRPQSRRLADDSQLPPFTQLAVGARCPFAPRLQCPFGRWLLARLARCLLRLPGEQPRPDMVGHRL